MKNYHKIKLLQIMDEANRHIYRMVSAKNKMKTFMPLHTKGYLNLHDDEIEHIDQFIFRFSKLQDCIGEKLFKIFLANLEEDVKGKPFIDILNRLEELNFIQKTEWLYLRKLRNQVAHEYSTNTDDIVEAINLIFKNAKTIYNIFKKFKEFIFNKIIKNDEMENKNLLQTVEF